MPDQPVSQAFPARLVALREQVAHLLSTQQHQWHREYIEAGESGLALEMLADWLSEDETPIPSAVRAEMVDLSHAVGINGRVSRALAYCPDR
ncbi:MafI family immunity protein [Kibdelosporangium phytohabitans]|uniref:MafI family immunity protein n=1 Tax=Kibdelosporangium phytohabitans TaxID=860235 RepID=A0A0N9HVB7_9PSEU|nr:MafI family immunity protein [Kibdelosporangium phytohabitans]ALG05856.1 hypothetical protein AOZ06_02010 [Kibdelosporangium phytohabitans]MBE1466111.1 hypothetical protein [Kibdelosporangium phytohabitans]